MIKIAFVCTGNTCRSAMAECILKKLIKDNGLEKIKVSSCGLNVTETAMSSYARKALNNLEIKPRKFVPKQFDGALLRKQNAIVCMTKMHKNALIGFKNIYTLDELVGCGDIPDPYGLGEEVYSEVAGILYIALEKLLQLLKED